MNKFILGLSKNNFFLVCLIFSFFIYFIHFIGERNSMLNITPFEYNIKTKNFENSYLEEVIIYHKDQIAFEKRKVNIKLIEFVSYAFRCSKSLSFVILNFIYLVLSGIFLSKICQMLYLKKEYTYMSLLAFYFNFSILFAFFPPIYTFDDLLQYLTVLLAVFFILKRNLIAFFIFYTISVLTRESSLFISPILIYFIYTNDIKSKKIYLGSIVITVIVYVVYLFNVTNMYSQYNDVTSRGKYLWINFSSYHHTVESLLAWISIYSIPLVLSISHFKKLSKNERILILIFWGIVLFNSILVYITCKVREARLLNIPIILFLPLFGKLLAQEVKLFWIYMKYLVNSISFWFYLIISGGISFYISKYAYKTSIGVTSEMYFNCYYFFILMSFFILFYHQIHKKLFLR